MSQVPLPDSLFQILRDLDKRVKRIEKLLTGLYVAGHVDSDGTTLQGVGFTVVQDGTGNYTVTYDEDFSDVPVVVCNAVSTGGIYQARAGASTASSFTVNTINTSNVSADSQFTFHAISV